MRAYLVVFAAAAATTWLLTPAVRWVALQTGAMSPVRDRDVHDHPIPRMGGVGIFAGVLVGMLVAHHVPVVDQVFHRYSEPGAVLVAGGLVCALGVLDDRWGLDALTKLSGQIVAAGVLVLLGVQLSDLQVPWVGTVSLGPQLGVPLTVALTVLFINAINFIDGLDGLAAGVVAIAALASYVYSYQLQVDFRFIVAAPGTLTAIVLAGACVGFLPHNFHPAKLFMGDSGSMLLGLMLSAATVAVTGQVPFGSISAFTSLPFLVPLAVPLAVLAVPFADLVFAVARRTRAGRPPWAPDKQHLHHRLLRIGHSQRRAVLLMYLWSAVLAFGVVVLSFSRGPFVALGLLATVAVAGLVVYALPRLRVARHSRG